MMSPACDFFRICPGQLQHLQQGSPVTQRSLAGALNYRPVSHRIAEGNAQFNYLRAGVDGCQGDVQRSRKIGVAASEIGDESRTILESQRHR